MMTDAPVINSTPPASGTTPETPIRELVRHCGPAILFNIPGFGTSQHGGADSIDTYGYMHPAHPLGFQFDGDEIGHGFYRGATAIPFWAEEWSVQLPGSWGLLVIANHKGVLICCVAIFPQALPELHDIIRSRIMARTSNH